MAFVVVVVNKSERGRRSLVVASQAVGVVAVCHPHRRPNPFVSGQSFHFQMTVALAVQEVLEFRMLEKKVGF